MASSILTSPFQVFTIGALLCLWIFSRLHKKRINPHNLPFPPGPRGLPLIGSVLELPISKPWHVYAEWFKKYKSDIIYFEALGQPFLVVNTLERIHDIFEKRSSNYSDRIHMPMILELMGWDYNLGILPYGDWWRRHRRAFHEHFRPNAVEQYKPIQLHATRGFLRQLLETPDDFLQHVRHTFAVIIMKITYGLEVQGAHDEHVHKAEVSLEGFAEAVVPGRFLVDFIPALKYVPEWFPGTEFKRKARYWREINKDVVTIPFEQVKKDMEIGTAVPSLATKLIEKLPGEDNPRRKEEEDIARHVSAVAYAGGADTTQSVVQAFFLAMAMYPSVQKKAQEQIDTVVGTNRLPDFDDRPGLPYINAMVKEAMRWQVVLPLGIPHMSTNEDEYDGYYIPKGAVVMGSTWELLRDPEAFENPDDFIPDRYLTPDGQLNTTVRDPDVAAFGYGRRICPGRYMSDNSLYITIASLLATYDIKPPLDNTGNEVKLKLDITNGAVTHPLPFKCRIAPRSPAAESLIRESEGLY